MSSSTFQRPVALGRIDYMNVAPVYFGLDNGMVPPDGIDVIAGPPSTLNQMMAAERLDISPVSAAAYARNAKDWMILPDLAIACHERVLSVLLVSRHPLDDLSGRRLQITDESASARDLCRLIFRLKDVHPDFVVGKVKTLSQLPDGVDAALVIGDAALSQPWERAFSHIYDLGTLWWEMTGFPFVFAVWAVRKNFARRHPERVDAVHSLLKRSLGMGNAHRESIVEKACSRLGIDAATARLYYQSLVYRLDDPEKAGLSMFYRGLHRTGILETETPLVFFDAATPEWTASPHPIHSKAAPQAISRETAGCCPPG